MECSLDYFGCFSKVSQAVTSTLDLKEVLQMLIESVAEVMQAKGSSIRLKRRDEEILETIVSHGLSETYLKKGILYANKSLKELITGKPFILENVWENPQTLFPEEAKMEGIKTIMGIPLRSRGNILGSLRIYFKEARKFTERDIEFLQSISDQGGIAIENARIYSEAKWKYFRTFLNVSKAISSTLELRAVLELIVKEITAALNVKGACLRLLQKDTYKLESIISAGLSQEYLNKGIIVNKNVMEMTDGKAVIFSNVSENPKIIYKEEAREEGIKTILGTPLKIRGRIIGSMRIYSSDARIFSQDDVDFLNALAEQCAIAIENARLYEEVKADYHRLMSDVESWFDYGKTTLDQLFCNDKNEDEEES